MRLQQANDSSFATLLTNTSGFPLGLENLENGGKAFSSQEILNRLEKSGKIEQITGKVGEFQTNFFFFFW